ncbi:MAG: DUF1573 domain-containing protein [Deltaproteobacteria bacterium]|jgi:hypothetical protein|nr:DUF1573 domain-containing protein [Deltaproteobacteria bacterium]
MKIISSTILTVFLTAFLMFFSYPSWAQNTTTPAPQPPSTSPHTILLKGPKASYDLLQYEAETVPAGNTLSHTFIVTNEGDDPLIIDAVIPNCGCTVANFDGFIPPGKSGSITVNIDLYKEWQGQEYLKSVTVITNDPQNPRQRLAIHGWTGAYKEGSEHRTIVSRFTTERNAKNTATQ